MLIPDKYMDYKVSVVNIAIRPFTVGRKNWLFSESVEGVNASATVYSIVEIAKAHNLNVYRYLVYLLEHRLDITMSEEEFERRAPWNQDVIDVCKNKME